ncbi:hypothetical protein BDB01DRAFT_849006 [Pilobolus umbonatus]|nr:hypothetical protein BDB01DRAFT_849006 [Pilobolus umbonatus]
MSNNTFNILTRRSRNTISNEEREEVQKLISKLDEGLTEVVPTSYIEGGLGCPDCSLSFSLRNNLRAHLLRVHQKKVEHVDRSKGGKVAAFRRQLAMAANYKKRKEQKLAGIIKAEVLESYGEINARGLRFHLLATKANYAQEIKSKFLLVAGLTEDDEEERKIVVEEEMKEKLVAYLTAKVGQWEVRHVLMKHVLTLFHAQFSPFEYELERMLQLEQLLSCG